MQPPSSAEWTAKVASWNLEKGYGFLQFGDKRVFLHRRDLVGAHRTPAVGDEVRFLIGHDDQGRACAQKAVCLRGGLGVSFFSLVLLGLLLVLPAIALHRLMPEVSPLGTGAYALVASIMTYGAYATDKRRAQTGQWRTSEATLHLFELLGGWPGAWVAQKRLRHKTAKQSYQFTFAAIIFAWQFAAFDSLQDWKCSSLAREWIMQQFAQRR